MTKFILSEGSTDLFGLTDITDVIAFHVGWDDVVEAFTVKFGDYDIAHNLTERQARFVMENLADFLAPAPPDGWRPPLTWHNEDCTLLWMDVLAEYARESFP